MCQTHQTIEKFKGCLIGYLIDRFFIGRLDHFEILRTEIIPDQFIYRIQCIRNSEFLKMILNLSQCYIEFAFKPLHGQFRTLRRFQIAINFPTLHQSERIPDLVTEVPSLFYQFIVIWQIISGL